MTNKSRRLLKVIKINGNKRKKTAPDWVKALNMTLLVVLFLESFIFWDYYKSTQKQLAVFQKGKSVENGKTMYNNQTIQKIESNIAEKVTLDDNIYDTYVIDLRKSSFTFHHTDDNGKIIETFSNLKKYFDKKSKNLIFATNGGIYTPSLKPLGLYVEKGKEITPLNLEKGNDNFYMEPNGIFYIKDNKPYIEETSNFGEDIGDLDYATQSGPMLLVNGNFHPKFVTNSENKNIRSGVGVIDENRIVIVISNQPVNFYDFANLFKKRFQCKNALYLDGAISKMYLPELSRTYLDDNIHFGSFICVESK